ncbi:3-carboxy-cis,cis-muconate cycloisomerase [Mycetocola zhujimingii]|nr:3-carboxy-cis,cis-muconate cycloisomerase [Mycetocola zhujimingii]
MRRFMAEHPTAEATDWGLLEPLAVTAAVTSDDAVLEALVEVERALVLARGRIIGKDLSEVAQALQGAQLDRAELISGARTGGVPVIPLVIQLRALAESAVPGSGAHVHQGATSQDILDTALMLVAKRALGVARERLRTAGESLVALAIGERYTISIARTLGQHAAQSTVGVSVAGWLDGIAAAMDALAEAGFPVQLGGAVGTGEDFDREADVPHTADRVRSALAEQLGLDDPERSWHTERSHVLRVASAAALVTTALGRIGRDVAFLARTEIGEASLGATGGSSAMPHKRNPVDAVLLTANGLRVPGLVATVHSAALAQDARPAGEWHAEWSAFRGLLRLAVESSDAAASMFARLSFDRSAVEANRLLSPDLERDAAATRVASDRIIESAIGRFRAVERKEQR